MKFLTLFNSDSTKILEGTKRLVDISLSEGIKAWIGRTDVEPDSKPVVESFLFDETRWTQENAAKWQHANQKYNLESLVTLYKEQPISSAPEKVTKFFKVKILHIDKENHIARAQVTNEDKDRADEILLMSSWQKRSKRYKEHPILVSSHNYWNLTSQIGEATNIDWKTMTFDFKWYYGEGNPEVDWGWKLAEKGMAMFSVGFLPYKRLTGDAIPEEYREKQPRAVYTDNELLEVSQVVVGCNQGALQCGIGAPNQDQVQYMYEVVKSCGSEIPEFMAVKPAQPAAAAPADQGTATKINKDSVLVSPVNIKNMKDLEQIMTIWKEGRVLSEKNRETVKSAVSQLQKTVEALLNLLELTNPKEEGGEEKFVFGDWLEVDGKLVRKQKS